MDLWTCEPGIILTTCGQEIKIIQDGSRAKKFVGTLMLFEDHDIVRHDLGG